jgi:hypothetical protein
MFSSAVKKSAISVHPQKPATIFVMLANLRKTLCASAALR